MSFDSSVTNFSKIEGLLFCPDIAGEVVETDVVVDTLVGVLDDNTGVNVGRVSFTVFGRSEGLCACGVLVAVATTGIVTVSVFSGIGGSVIVVD